MVSVQIYGTSDYLEVLDPQVTYVKTAGDLGSITNINSSYSWTFQIPKSPNNTIVLDGLGLVGSQSRKPYQKIYCNVLDNGFPIVIKGLLNIRDTVDDYNCFVQEGFIDFLKAINNDTIGEGIDLEDLNHDRNYANIINSFSLSLPYAYLISDVNGAYFQNIAGTTNLNPKYMAPFANEGYVLDLIFSTYGWTYTANQNVLDSINNTWMSYPSEIVLDTSGAVRVAEMSGTYIYADYYKGGSGSDFVFKIPMPTKSYDVDFIIPLNTSDKDFVVQTTGDYEFKFASNGQARFYDPWGNITFKEYATVVIRNGSIISNPIEIGSSDGRLITNQYALNAGDIISLGASFPSFNNQVPKVFATFGAWEIYDASGGSSVSFTKAFIKLKISDFIKEVMTRESLTAFTDSENKHIDFLTLEERISQDAVDWSDRYVKRTKESYLYKDYNQQNWMRHKYSEELASFNDGSLSIDNANLDLTKNIYESLSFSPDRDLSTFTENSSGYKVPRLPMFEVDVKEDESTGDLIGTYKFKEGRFFFVKSQWVNKTIYIQDNEVVGFPMANINGNVFKDIVFNNYKDFVNLSQDAKVHDIELALSLSDIISLDLSKLYYFDSEASYYVLNRLTYKTGENTKGEFLKIQPKKELSSFSNGWSGAFNI